MRKTKQAMAWLLISAMMGSQTIPAFAAPDVVGDQQVTERTSVETEEVDEPEAESKESMEETEEETPEESSEDASEEETSEEETAEEETPEEETSEEETVEESVPGSVAETVPETSAPVLEEDPIIDMPDENLKKLIINDGFDKNGDEELSVSELEDLYRIEGSGKSIADLTGLEYAPNLTYVDLSFNPQLSDLSSLESAFNLSGLYVWGCNISDIEPLSGLINLKALSIGGNHLLDILALKNLINLGYLDISENRITDLSPLCSLTKLNNIDAAKNQITEMPDLSGLTNLKLYYCTSSTGKKPYNMFGGNKITRDEFAGKFAEEPGEDWLDLNSYNTESVTIPDAALKTYLLSNFDQDGDGELSVSEMKKVYNIICENAGITDLTGLEYAVNLSWLNLKNNQITDLSPIRSLTSLSGLDVSGNNLTEIPDLRALVNLQFYYETSGKKVFNNMFGGNQIPREGFVGKFATEPGEDWLALNSYDESIVEIPDQALKSRLLARFDKNQDGELSKSEMSQIEYFDAYNAGITDLTGLEYATEISSLEVPYNGIKDLAPISKLPNLQYLNVKENQITKVPDFTETNLLLYDFVWDADKQEHVQTTPRNIFGGNQILKEQFVGKFATEPGEDWLALNSYDESIVEIPDQALKSRLLAQFDKNQDGELSKSEMSQIEYFDAYDAGITDLTGLEYVIGIFSLKLPFNNIEDLTSISRLPNLQILDVKGNRITKVPSFVETSLRLYETEWDADKQKEIWTTPKRIFTGNKISREEFVGKFSVIPGEDWLELNSYDTTLIEIPDSALKKQLVSQYDADCDGELSYGEMNSIEFLNAANCGITDLTGLEYASGLEGVNISDNNITDLTPLTKIAGLQYLYANGNQISQIPDFRGTHLKLYENYGISETGETTRTPIVMFSGNPVKKEEFAGKFPEEPGEDWLERNSYNDTPVNIPDDNLRKALLYLDSDGDGVLTVEDLRKINGSVYYGNSDIKDLTGLEYAINMTGLQVPNNQITDLAPIKNLTNLMLLDISNNDINDLTPILGLTRLQNLYARNNKLTEIPDMKGLSSLMLYSSINGDPESIFIGNLIPRERFEGKFNQKLTEEWLNKNSYDATVIEIPDENLAKAIRNLVPDSDGDGKFNKSELSALTTLYANGRHIKDLTGLEYAENLVAVGLEGNQIMDVTPLANLTKLAYVDLIDNQITDIAPLASLKQLQSLKLSNNQITDISPLAEIKGLRELRICNNKIQKIPDLTGLGSLELYVVYSDRGDVPVNMFSGNMIPREEFIGKFAYELTDEWLDINSYDNTEIIIPDPILKQQILNGYDYDHDGKVGKSEILALQDVEFDGDIKSLEGLEQAKNLMFLYVNGTKITDISPLENLDKLEGLDLSSNWISDISKLPKNLVWLTLDNNQVEDISVLAKMPRLYELSLLNNDISSIPDLSELDLLLYFPENGSPINIFGGNSKLTSREQFEGKFAQELTDEWLEENLSGNTEIVNIPDKNFKQALFGQRVDSDNDGEITVANLKALSYLNVTGKQIYDLTGIEYATNLTRLRISDNNITSLESLTKCKKLKSLIAKNNRLSTMPDWKAAGIELNLWEHPNMFSGNYLTREVLEVAFGYLEPDENWYQINSVQESDNNYEWKETEDGHKICYLNGEQLIDECLKIDGEYYYFDSDGYMVTNTWYHDGNLLRYFREDGTAIRNHSTSTICLEEIGEKWYAFDQNAVALTGWTTKRGERLEGLEDWKTAIYHFDEQTGEMEMSWTRLTVYGGWKNPDGYAEYWFYFGTSARSRGRKKYNIWITDSHDWTYYGNETGAFLADGLHEIDGVVYAFSEKCVLLKNTELVVNGVIYTIDENGVATVKQMLEIIEQPQNVMVTSVTDKVVFNVQANQVKSYQWQFSRDNGATWQAAGFPGNRTEEMTVELNAARMKYLFRCEVTGKDGSKLYTDVVKAEEAFKIIEQPSDVEVMSVDETVTFEVGATGVKSYQWQFSRDNGNSWQATGFTGNRTSKMTVELNASRIKYLFRCELTGVDGNKLYTDAVKAEEKFAISKQPSDVAVVNADETVTFEVGATGVSGYQWQFSRDNGNSWQATGFTGNRTSKMTVELNASRIKYLFRCELTGADGNKLYTDAVKAEEKFAITSQPSDVDVTNTNEIVAFKVEAAGVGSYQWQFSRNNGASWQSAGFTGSRTSEMTVELNASRMNYLFRCELTGKDGSKKLYTDTVSAKVKFAITKEPEDVQTTEETAEAVFKVEAVGASGYQWQFSRDNGNTWQSAGFKGSRTSEMTVELNSVRRKYVFRCELTGADGRKLYTGVVGIRSL